MDKDSNHYFQKLKAHLPLVKDPTVVILRGHLLMEELLDTLIGASLKNALALKDARLTFFQKLCIVRGIIGTSNEDDLWKPIEALNKLRNNISHYLPNEELSQKLDPVLKAFFPSNFEEIPDDVYSKSKALRKGIIFNCAMLFGFIKGIKETSNNSTGSLNNPAPSDP